jgi:hypothetical protein
MTAGDGEMRHGGEAMSDGKQLKVTRTVRAPADQIFALLTDPKQHVVIDGSGTLQGSDSGLITEIGQIFAVNMYREDLGPYRTLNTVTALEPGRRIGWAPDLDPECELAPRILGVGIKPGGHTYVYDFRENDGVTDVTQTYDWSGVTDPKFEALACPFVTREELMATLDRLADAVESPA